MNNTEGIPSMVHRGTHTAAVFGVIPFLVSLLTDGLMDCINVIARALFSSLNTMEFIVEVCPEFMYRSV